MKPLTTRRSALRTLLQAGMGAATLPLLGVGDALGGVASQCPGADPFGWVPDVMHPVAAGFQDLDVADSAPGPVRVWYPTAETLVKGRPAKFLKHCTARWPVVMFLHGQQPCPSSTDPNYYKRWTSLPANLARSGYVVLVPSHSQGPQSDGSEAPFLASFIDWARNVWENAGWLDQRPDAVAVGGHSRGAVATARVAQIRTDISAFFSLGGAFHDVTDVFEAMSALNRPTFYMWSTTNSDSLSNEWARLHEIRYAAEYAGNHFDYIDIPAGCDEAPGPCRLVRPVADDLVTLFVSRYLPVAASTTRIPVLLSPPPTPLTAEQQRFGSNRLVGLELIKSSRDCAVDMKFKSLLLSGSIHFGA